MTIVGFGFNKMLVEKNDVRTPKISIHNNIVITGVEKVDLSVGKSHESALKFSFKFASKYEPGVGRIEMDGFVHYIDDEGPLSTIVKDWDKGKHVEKDVSTSVLNHALTRCNVQALLMSQTVNLPAPIPMPTLQPVEKAAAKPAPSKKK